MKHLSVAIDPRAGIEPAFLLYERSVFAIATNGEGGEIRASTRLVYDDDGLFFAVLLTVYTALRLSSTRLVPH